MAAGTGVGGREQLPLNFFIGKVYKKTNGACFYSPLILTNKNHSPLPPEWEEEKKGKIWNRNI